jgi:hypothetical protein
MEAKLAYSAEQRIIHPNSVVFGSAYISEVVLYYWETKLLMKYLMTGFST